MREAPAGNIFGMILRGEIPSWEVYSGADTFAFLDIFPQAPGHTLVIPRNYSEHLVEASDVEVEACLRTVRKLLPAVRDAVGARGATVLTNIGAEAGQTVPYLHWHIIPRKASDHVSLYKPGEQLQQDQAEAILQAIRGLL